MLLLIISFLAGVLTILAPCTLPLLPVIIGSAVNGQGVEKPNLKKALVIASSLGASVVIFTILLKISTLFIDIPPAVWSIVSGLIILIFGFISLFPSIWERIPLVAKINTRSNKLMSLGYKKQGISGDIIIGASLGPVFSTCSPTYFIILATVLPQSLLFGFVCLLAYALGLAGVLLLVAFLGQRLVVRLGGISDTHGWFKKTLGALFIIIGIAILFGVDKKIEVALLKSNLFDITKVEQKLLRFNESFSGKREISGTIAPELVDPSGYINTDEKPITIGEFKDKKVVLLDMWTYSCINCQRTIPYLKAWDEKYGDLGLEIIGLHTPEFAFEQVKANVEKAVDGFGIKYPVVLDNDYATWNAYGNNSWPRKYLISADGTIAYDHTGEGKYEETERAIQKALVELHQKLGDRVVIPMDIVNPSGTINPNQGKVKSPEIYFGSSRNEYLGNGKAKQLGEQSFALPASYSLNNLYLEGKWKINPEEAKAESAGKIVFKYSAKNVYMVASSDMPAGTIITIKKDGVVVKTVTVIDNTLYTLIEGGEYGEHLLEIDIPGAGFDAFTFTFG